MTKLEWKKILSRLALAQVALLVILTSHSPVVSAQSSGGVFGVRMLGCDIPPDPKDVAVVKDARQELEKMEISGLSEKALIKQMGEIRQLEYKTEMQKQHVIKDRHGTRYTTKQIPHPVETPRMAIVLKRLFPRIQMYLLQRKNSGDQYVWENIIDVASNYQYHGLKQETLELLEMISKKDVNVPPEKLYHAYAFKVRVYDDLGEAANSETCCKEAISAGEIFAKSNPWVWEQIAALYEKIGDKENAAIAFEKLFAETKNPYKILRTPNYYDVLNDIGRKEEAARLRTAYEVMILAGPSIRWPGNKESALNAIKQDPSIAEILPSYTLASLGLKSLAEKRRAEESKTEKANRKKDPEQ